MNDVQRMSCERIDREIVCCEDCIYGMSISFGVDEMTCEVLDSKKKVWIPVSSPESAFSGDSILPSLKFLLLATTLKISLDTPSMIGLKIVGAISSLVDVLHC